MPRCPHDPAGRAQGDFASPGLEFGEGQQVLPLYSLWFGEADLPERRGLEVHVEPPHELL